MSVQTEVLYGNRLYSQETYSSNQDPQTISVSLADSSALSDARIIDDITQVLTDLITMADARAMNVNKPLADSTTISDSVVKVLTAVLADSESMSDAKIVNGIKVLPPIPRVTGPFPLFGSFLYTVPMYGCTTSGMYEGTIVILDSVLRFLSTKILADTATMTEVRIFMATKVLADAFVVLDSKIISRFTKHVTDFVKLHEWISIKLHRAEVWVSHSAVDERPSVEILYDKELYSDPLYSNSHHISWITTLDDTASWTSPASDQKNPQVYGKFLYSQMLYGNMPSATWTNPPEDATPNFTNFDGEGNVP